MFWRSTQRRSSHCQVPPKGTSGLTVAMPPPNSSTVRPSQSIDAPWAAGGPKFAGLVQRAPSQCQVSLNASCVGGRADATEEQHAPVDSVERHRVEEARLRAAVGELFPFVAGPGPGIGERVARAVDPAEQDEELADGVEGHRVHGADVGPDEVGELRPLDTVPRPRLRRGDIRAEAADQHDLFARGVIGDGRRDAGRRAHVAELDPVGAVPRPRVRDAAPLSSSPPKSTTCSRAASKVMVGKSRADGPPLCFCVQRSVMRREVPCSPGRPLAQNIPAADPSGPGVAPRRRQSRPAGAPRRRARGRSHDRRAAG